MITLILTNGQSITAADGRRLDYPPLAELQKREKALQQQIAFESTSGRGGGRTLGEM